MLRLRNVYKKVFRRFATEYQDEDDFKIKSHFWKTRVEDRKNIKEFVDYLNPKDELEYEGSGFDVNKKEPKGNLTPDLLKYLRLLQRYKYKKNSNKRKIIRI